MPSRLRRNRRAWIERLALLRHRRELSPERVERVAVETPRTCFEPAGIGQVRRADLRDVYLQRGVLAYEDPGRAGMVEMNVGEEQVAKVLELEPALAQGRVQALEACRGAAVEERRSVLGLDEVGADDALRALIVEIERSRAQ